MTRPMPGPPHRYYIDSQPLLGMLVVNYPGERVQVVSHAALDKKRLTDAECAAEYWRAEADSLYSHPAVESWSARPTDAISRGHIWHRFATTPHALEEA